MIPATQTASTAADPICRVMICDDSAVIRSAIARILESDPLIRVVVRVADGQAALRAIPVHDVDVVVLDIEMPVMDGLTALPLLLRADPTLRVVMASTLTTRGADVALRALRLGAADYVPKPSAAMVAGDTIFARELIEKVKGLARLRRQPRRAVPVMPLRTAPAAVTHQPRLLAIGSSTGGPQALFTLVQGLGRDLPVPAVLTQHMPATFTPILAEHITRLGALPCAEARDGEMLQPGRLYLAPGDWHLLVQESGGGFWARLSDGPAENFCRPSVDPMLRSVTAATRGRALMVMLTGMGHDGLEGTTALIAAGGTAIAQDEASSVVWGMPGAIARAGLCRDVLPLPEIAPRVRALLGAAQLRARTC